MNLKEAFRYQNKISSVLDKAQDFLNDSTYTTTTKTIHYKSSIIKGMEDEQIVTIHKMEKEISVNQLIDFLYIILSEKEKLCQAVSVSKQNNEFSIDAAIEANIARQSVVTTLNQMIRLKAKENLIKNGGCGYLYKEDYKEESSYHYDLKEIVTINFDRNKVKKLRSKISLLSDETSENLEKSMLLTEVNYTPIFDVNSSFEEILEDYFA